MAVEELLVKNLNQSPADAFRVHRNQAVIREYAKAQHEGDKFPPIDVFRNGDGKLWVADGAYRIAAWKLNGLKTIKANVHEGARTEAIEFAAGANARHGMRRSAGDVALIITYFLR